MYRPRVQAAVVGQEIEFKNSDKTSHNIHTKHMPLGARQATETLMNRGQPAGAPDVAMVVQHDSDVYEVRCDQHAWMRGYVVLSDNPYAVVTGKDGGTITLKDVPVGEYTLQSWHAFYGVKEAKVKVVEGETTEFSFVYDGEKDRPGGA